MVECLTRERCNWTRSPNKQANKQKKEGSKQVGSGARKGPMGAGRGAGGLGLDAKVCLFRYEMALD